MPIILDGRLVATMEDHRALEAQIGVALSPDADTAPAPAPVVTPVPGPVILPPFPDAAGVPPAPGAPAGPPPAPGPTPGVTPPAPPPTSAPPGAFVVNPGDDIAAAVAAQPTGQVFWIARGTYRGAQFTPKASQRFIGETGATMNGSIVLSTWTAGGGMWSATGLPAPRTQDVAANTPIGTDGTVITRHPNDLFRDGVPLKRVATLASVASGKWFFDEIAFIAYIADDPTGRLMELSVTPYCVGGAGATSGVSIENLIVEKYATSAMDGAIRNSGPSMQIINTTVRGSHGAGIIAGPTGVIQGGAVLDCGQIGIYGTGCNSLIVVGVEIARCNLAGYDSTWHAGGMQIETSDDVTFRNDYVHDNLGPGVSAKTGCQRTTYDSNIVVTNRESGILDELGYSGTILNNVVLRNGDGGGLTFADFFPAQIHLETSSNVVVRNNYVEVSATGVGAIGMRHSARGSGRLGTYELQNNAVHDNDVVHLGLAGRSGVLSNSAATVAYLQNQIWDLDRYHVPDVNRAIFDVARVDYAFTLLQSSTPFEHSGIIVAETRTATPTPNWTRGGISPVPGPAPLPTPPPAPPPGTPPPPTPPPAPPPGTPPPVTPPAVDNDPAFVTPPATTVGSAGEIDSSAALVTLTASTYDPLHKSNAITLFNGNYTAQETLGDYTHHTARATVPLAGKRKWEHHCDVKNAATNHCVLIVGEGITNFDTVVGEPGADDGCTYVGDGPVFYNNDIVATLAPFNQGDIVMVAFDSATAKVWFGVNGTWSGSPSAGTGQAVTLTPGHVYYPGVELAQANDANTIRMSTASQTYAAPTGFTQGEPNNLRLTGSTLQHGVGSAAANVFYCDGGNGPRIIEPLTGGNLVVIGSGQCTIVFVKGNGVDQYWNFRAGAGGDIIDLHAFPSLVDWPSIQATIRQFIGYSSISLGAGDVIRLTGVTASSLTAANFMLNGAIVAAGQPTPPPIPPPVSPPPPAAYTLAITSPASGATLTGTAPITISAPGMLNAEFYKTANTGSTSPNFLGRVVPNAAGDATFNLSTTALPVGSFTLVVHAWDAPPGQAFLHEAETSRAFVIGSGAAPPPTGLQPFVTALANRYTLARNYDFGTNIPDYATMRQFFQTRYPYANWTIDKLNDEWQRYRDNNNHVFITNPTDGGPTRLQLVARQVGGNFDGGIESGMIAALYQQHGGVIECRMKLPRVLGCWPAFWIVEGLPNIQWPPEIDVMEYVVNNFTVGAVESPYSCRVGQCHENAPRPNFGDQIYSQTYNNVGEFSVIPGYDFSAAYHTWTIAWDPATDRMQQYLDQQMVVDQSYAWRRQDGSPCSDPMFFVNLAIGGAWAGRNGVDASAFPVILEVDWLRFWT